MRRTCFYFFLLMITILSAALPVQAKSDIRFKELQVEIWPEYDRPDVLIMYRITLSSDVSYPCQLTLKLPRDAGAPFNVAMQETDGFLYDLAYNTVVEGDWLIVSFTTPSPIIQLEYYDPRLYRSSGTRNFLFIWPGDYSVDNLMVTIQHPTTANGMQVLPDLGLPIKGKDGFFYTTAKIGAVQQGNTYMVRISYQKEDDNLSLGLEAVQPVEPMGNFDQVNGLTNRIYWIIAIASIILIGLIMIAIYSYLIYRKKLGYSLFSGKKSIFRKQQGYSQMIYCQDCGQRALPGDVYCRTCGARLKGGSHESRKA